MSRGYAAASAALFYYSVLQAFRLAQLSIANFRAVVIPPRLATIALVGIVLAVVAMLSSFWS